MKKTEQHIAFEKWIVEWARKWISDEAWPDLGFGEHHHDTSGYQCGETRLLFTCWNAAIAASTGNQIKTHYE